MDKKRKHDRDIRLASTQTSAVSEHGLEAGHYPFWNEVEFTDRGPHCHTCWLKEVIHIRLHPNNSNRDSGIEIPEIRMPTIKQHNNRKKSTRTDLCGRPNNGEDRNAKITADWRDMNGAL